MIRNAMSEINNLNKNYIRQIAPEQAVSILRAISLSALE